MTLLRMLGLRVGAVLAVASVLWFGSLAAVPSVHANGTAAVFYGQVLPDGTGEFPIRVRAVADSGVVCGTGTVQVERTRASYAIRVATAGLRDGCPGDGEPVNLVLLYGLIDEGGPAASRITIFAGEVAELSLARPAALSY